MTETLNGRHVVVTGGTGALGGAVVGRLLEQGAICHVPNAHAAAPPHFPYAAHASVHLAHNVDLSDSAKVEAFYHQVPELWASIHLAGGFTMAPVEKIESASFAEMMDTNARTTFLCSRAAIRSMLASGTAGRIVNVTARAGLDPRRGAGMVAYAASKAAVAAMTVAMAEELKAKGPDARRNLDLWGQVGVGAIALGCVSAAALGQVAVGIPCVIGGAASQGLLSFWEKQQ